LRLKSLERRQAQELMAANCDAHLLHARQLLQHFSESDVYRFMVAPPSNPQNDCVYVAHSALKKQISAAYLLQTRAIFKNFETGMHRANIR